MAMRDAVRQLAAYRFQAYLAEVKLDQNEVAYDLPEALKREALRRIAEVPFNRYPQVQAGSLRERLAEFHGWPPDGVVVGGGSNVLIQALVVAGALGRSVVTVTPTFPVYALEAQILGAELHEHALAADFALPTAALQRSLAQGTGVAFIANPAAPTGNRHPDADIERLAANLGSGWTLVLDEAYAPFAGRDHLDLVRGRAGLVSLRTFSKAFGLGGVRLGYALGEPELATDLRKVVLPFSVSELQIAVAGVLLDHPELIEERVAEVVRERSRLAEVLAHMPGIVPYPSDTNFVLFGTPDAAAVHAGLLRHSVLVRRQDHLAGLGGCLRVTVGDPAENGRFLEALAAVLDTMAVTSDA